jgi:indolepyruvate ferredoxin oxidoreductase
MDQMRRDRRAGLKTAAFISGYEGSPLGGYDLQLARSRKLLDEHNVHFRPGLNEELAATSVMGSQVFEVVGKTTVDGVVGFWYGKGPGVDRSGDIFRHANMAGTGKHGGAVVLAGDDHACKSSTIPHQSDFSLYNFGIPFLYPGNTQEVIDYGLLAVALSRYSGAWVGLKLVTDICDGGGTVMVDPDRRRFDCRRVIRRPWTRGLSRRSRWAWNMK